MDGLTIEQIAQRACDAKLITLRQLQEAQFSSGGQWAGADDAVQALIRRGLLTKYQVDLLVRGEPSGYFYGDYKVLYLAGMGTFARVFRAAHRTSGDVVAVKVLRERFSAVPEDSGQFVREGELGRTLRHPNIVPIYEVSSQQNEHFLVMEFVEGCTLLELVRVRKELDPVTATRFMADIARGLQYAAARSISHRDLRMSNVLVSSRGVAKLVDFGLAGMGNDEQAGNSDAQPGRTIEYACLERETGVGRDDARSDIFFAGCLFYHMLCGKSPIGEGRSRALRMNRARFREIVPLAQAVPSLPLAVTAIVSRAMALDPARRYQTPSELLADAEQALKRLEGGAGAHDASASARSDGPGEEAEVAQPDRFAIVAEAHPQMQDMLREGLKKAGYRVFLTRDPHRAFERLFQNPESVDCVVFGAREIGESAVECFNRMAAYPWAQSLPAILLLGETQRIWSARAVVSACRRVLPMPVTMARLRAVLKELSTAEKP